MLKKNLSNLCFFAFLIKNTVFLLPNYKKTNFNKMKKVLSIIAVAAMTTAFVSCGPSKEEMEKRKQAQEDSIAAVEAANAAEEAAKAQAMVDSSNAYAAAQEAEAKRVADSIDAATPKGKGGKKK